MRVILAQFATIMSHSCFDYIHILMSTLLREKYLNGTFLSYSGQQMIHQLSYIPRFSEKPANFRPPPSSRTINHCTEVLQVDVKMMQKKGTKLKIYTKIYTHINIQYVSMNVYNINMCVYVHMKEYASDQSVVTDIGG